ncbi:MAG: response regulator [Ferruginibacter sp.]|nr:response regulator [Rhodoferax sp.]
MKDAILAAQARWRMLIPIFMLVAGGLLVVAIAYMERSQGLIFEQNLAKMRDLRMVHMALSSRVLATDWSEESEGAVAAEGRRTEIAQDLAHLGSLLKTLEPDPDGLVGLVDNLLSDFSYTVVRGEPRARQAQNAEFKRAFLALDSGMGRLESYNVGRLRTLTENQRLQLNLMVGAALLTSALAGLFVLRDHHRLNRTEKNLHTSESYLLQVLELTPQLALSWDIQGDCDYLSNRWVAYTGMPTDCHLGTGWTLLIHPEDRDKVLRRWRACIASKDSFEEHLRLRGHDGTYRWFDARAALVYGAGAEPFKWFGTCTDVQERALYHAALTRNSEQLETQVDRRTATLISALDERSIAQQNLQQLNIKLREAEIFMRLVADNIPGYITYWDRELRCRFVNQANGLWFGHADNEILGRTIMDVWGPEVFGRIKKRVMAALSGEAQDFEREEFSALGEHAVNRVQYLPIVRDGEVQGFFILGTNITRHKQAEQLLQLSNAQLADARDRADSANRAKSNFLANMSHEIRTPMNAIIGLTHILRRDTEDPTNQMRLTKIDTVAHHLLQVINDILDLSKIEAGRMALEQIDFSLEALLARTYAMVQDSAREKGLDMVMDTTQIPDRLNGDPTRLMQALLNVWSNAVKFTERGSVALRADMVSQDGAHMLIRFEIRDTGVGIEPHVLSQLFSPFSQADDSSTRRHGGTGLGLTITRHIAELMGGEAGGESRPGEGSRFWITVRLRTALQPEAWGLPLLKGLRSLVIDDMPDERMAMADMLRTLGLRVDVAGSGAEALTMVDAEATNNDPYAVVVLDWKMPGMDGIETAQRLRAVFKPPPSMVLVSADGREELQKMAKDAGFGAVLLKPLTPAVLLDGLMHLLKTADYRPPPVLRNVEALENALREKHRGARVLLAEDNPVNQEVAAELLQAAGLVVDIASDGEQALRMVLRAPYALVLMDVQMPRMDGLQATRLMRQEPRLANLPIIAMTANAFSEDRQACLAAGMNDHLAKPVDPRVLHEALLRWLPARERRVAPAAPSAKPKMPKTAVQLLEGIEGLDLKITYAQCAGKPELALRVLRQFLAHYRNAGAALVDHLTEGELEEPRRKLHSLLGAAGAVGAVGVRESVLQLQVALKANAPLPQLLALGQILNKDLDALIAELARRLEA